MVRAELGTSQEWWTLRRGIVLITIWIAMWATGKRLSADDEKPNAAALLTALTSRQIKSLARFRAKWTGLLPSRSAEEEQPSYFLISLLLG